MDSRPFRPKKRLGQNFLVDKTILNQIVRYLDIQPGDTVLEIGAGRGNLTTRLAPRAEQVLAVELDESLYHELVLACAAYPNVRPILADVLKLDIAALLEELPRERVRVVGNLPYYITTPILMKLLAHRTRFRMCVLMVQWEVAQRLVSGPGSRAYGAPSVAVAYHTRARILRRVPGRAFRPSPKVESALVRLEMREQPAVAVADEALFFRIVRGVFQHRRKTLRNALIKSGVCPADRVDRVLERAALDPTLRPERLGLQEYAALTHATLEETIIYQ